LEWRIVGPTLYRYLRRLQIPVELYAPYGTPHEELQPTFLEREGGGNGAPSPSPPPSRIDPAWIALVEILARVEREPYHWPVGRTTFQKIAYFATEAGIPTGLHYQRSSFGPYAPELKALITRLANNALIREERLGRMFAVKVGPTFTDAQRAYKEAVEQWENIIEKLTDLFMRTNTQQAELVATVHFAAKSIAGTSHGQISEEDVFHEVMKWKQKRRPPLNEGEVALAIRHMSMLGWLDVRASEELPIVEEEALLDA